MCAARRSADASPQSVPVHLSVFGKTDLGRTREHNEDTFLVADLTQVASSLKPEVREHNVGQRGSLLLVADGMGGAAAGELASAMAAQTIYEHMSSVWQSDADASEQRFVYRMREAVELANQRLHAHARDRTELRGMGTTATVVGVLGQNLYLAQVGDSRAYLIRAGEATQLTKDQSLMQRLVDAGELTEEEAEQSQRKNIILQALGPEPTVKVDLTFQELRQQDTLVLCSDGLSGQVKPEEIADIAEAEDDLATVCSKLIDLANERGGPDNITVLVARVTGEALKDPEMESTAGHKVYQFEDEDDTEELPVLEQEGPPPEPALPARRPPVLAFMVIAGILAILAFFLILP